MILYIISSGLRTSSFRIMKRIRDIMRCTIRYSSLRKRISTVWNPIRAASKPRLTTSSSTAWSWAAAVSVFTTESFRRGCLLPWDSPRGSGEKIRLMMEAFKYGAPPHGGLAYGLDRLVMLMLGESSIHGGYRFSEESERSVPDVGRSGIFPRNSCGNYRYR